MSHDVFQILIFIPGSLYIPHHHSNFPWYFPSYGYEAKPWYPTPNSEIMGEITNSFWWLKIKNFSQTVKTQFLPCLNVCYLWYVPCLDMVRYLSSLKLSFCHRMRRSCTSAASATSLARLRKAWRAWRGMAWGVGMERMGKCGGIMIDMNNFWTLRG